MKRLDKTSRLTALCLCIMSAVGCAAAEASDAESGTTEGASALEAAASSEFVFASFKAQSSGKCLDIRGSNLIDGARLVAFPCNEYGNQLFQIVSTREEGYYQIRALHSGKCLDVQRASLRDGADVVQFECNGQYNQQFSFEPVGEDTFVIKPRHSGKCLDVRPGLLTESDPLNQYTCDEQPNQQFKIKLFRG